MRLVNAQRQLRERGRIRIGFSTLNAKGDKIPHRSDTFIFSAPDEQTIREVAALFGGEPEPWTEGNDRWRVITDAAQLSVVFVGHLGFSQEYVQYRKGFAVLRCDGARCWTPGTRKRLDEQACMCDPDQRSCQLTTHLQVILADLLGLGTWRLVTKSYYAAVELLATVELIESAVAAGMRVPARMFLTHREVRRLENGKPKVKKFPVIALDLNMSVAALDRGGVGAGAALSMHTPDALPASVESAAPALPQAWRPVDQQALSEAPPPDVRGLLAENERPVKVRANAAPPIPSTGVKPRTEAEAVAASPYCSVCGQPYGTAKLVKNPEPGGSRFVHATCLPEEGDLPADQPPPADEQARDGGGAAGVGEASAGAQPAPVTGPQHARMMSAPMQRKTMALAAEVWPAEKGASGPETDDMRRHNLLDLCAVLGQPGLTSRTQISHATGHLLIDALEELKEGRMVLTEAGLVDTETGEVKVPAP